MKENPSFSKELVNIFRGNRKQLIEYVNNEIVEGRALSPNQIELSIEAQVDKFDDQIVFVVFIYYSSIENTEYVRSFKKIFCICGTKENELDMNIL